MSLSATIRVILIVLLSGASLSANSSSVSITLDDFNLQEQTLLSAKERNEKILAVLKNRNLKAALFVQGSNIRTKEDRELLVEWGRSGHLIGNHTFSHRYFGSQVTLEEEISDILKCEDVLKTIKGFEKIFRFPMLAEGDTVSKRDGLRKWLNQGSYKQGAVTIDASDWYIDERLREKLTVDPQFDLKKYRDFYLEHILERAVYYNQLGTEILGREIHHTLLLHFNLLNALFLEDLLEMFEKRGWNLIGAAEAFRDPIFAHYPKGMPSGQSLVWGMAKETGKYDDKLRYPGEDSDYEKPKMDRLGL